MLRADANHLRSADMYTLLMCKTTTGRAAVDDIDMPIACMHAASWTDASVHAVWRMAVRTRLGHTWGSISVEDVRC